MYVAAGHAQGIHTISCLCFCWFHLENHVFLVLSNVYKVLPQLECKGKNWSSGYIWYISLFQAETVPFIRYLGFCKISCWNRTLVNLSLIAIWTCHLYIHVRTAESDYYLLEILYVGKLYLNFPIDNFVCAEIFFQNWNFWFCTFFLIGLLTISVGWQAWNVVFCSRWNKEEVI